MKRILKCSAICLLVCLMMAVVTCIFVLPRSETGNPTYVYNSKKYTLVQSHPDKILYDDIEKLEQSTQLIVIGEFLDNSSQQIFTRIDPNSGNEVIYNGITTNDFRINKVIKGNLDKDVIRISQRYFFDEDRQALVSFGEMTPMEKGTTWIYFLNYYDNDQSYWAVGDYTGRYPYIEFSYDDLIRDRVSPSQVGVFDKKVFLNIYPMYEKIRKKYALN